MITQQRVAPNPIPLECWPYLGERLNLSMRERQVAMEILQDTKEATIARRLDISTHTVHTHLERLYRKLGVSSRLQLAVCLFRNYLDCTMEPQSPLPPICPHHRARGCPLAD